MKSLKVLLFVLLAVFSFNAVDAQQHRPIHRKHRRHHHVVKHHVVRHNNHH